MALTVATIASILQGKLIASFYTFGFINYDNSFCFALAWIYTEFVCFYVTFLSTVLDLLPIILMTHLPPIVAALNSDLENLKFGKLEDSKEKVKASVAFHMDIKE
jgi:hypothetical protein